MGKQFGIKIHEILTQKFSGLAQSDLLQKNYDKHPFAIYTWLILAVSVLAHNNPYEKCTHTICL